MGELRSHRGGGFRAAAGWLTGLKPSLTGGPQHSLKQGFPTLALLMFQGGVPGRKGQYWALQDVQQHLQPGLGVPVVTTECDGQDISRYRHIPWAVWRGHRRHKSAWWRTTVSASALCVSVSGRIPWPRKRISTEQHPHIERAAAQGQTAERIKTRKDLMARDCQNSTGTYLTGECAYKYL